MVATKVLISLCVAQLAVAAPQLSLPGAVQRTAVNEGQIVTNVVTALQPSIAEAVARALASFQISSNSFNSNSGSSNSFNSNSGSSNSLRGSTESISGSAGPKVASTATKAEYNYEFKVADEEEQTYISQQESRDGDELTGTYSYVNPEGALITVNYQAGPMGYTQTLDKQEGFVSIKAQPVRDSSISKYGSSSSSSSNSGSSSVSAGSQIRGNTQQLSSFNSASALDESALISQIVSALQPQIQASVNSALASQQTNSLTTSRVVAAAPQLSAVGGSGGSVSSIFGDGYNVRIATPEYNIEY